MIFLHFHLPGFQAGIFVRAEELSRISAGDRGVLRSLGASASGVLGI